MRSHHVYFLMLLSVNSFSGYTEAPECQTYPPHYGIKILQFFFFYYIFLTCSKDLKYLEFFLFFFKILVGGKLFYSSVLVSAIHQHESTIGIHISPPSCFLLLFIFKLQNFRTGKCTRHYLVYPVCFFRIGRMRHNLVT